MSVTGTRDRGSNWCAGPGPASARQQQPGQTIFYSSFIDLIWSWPSATTQPETAGIAAENMFTNTNLKSSKSSSFKCNSFLTVCDKLRSLGIATVAMQQLGTCPLLFLDIRHNRRIERERESLTSSRSNLLFINHHSSRQQNVMWHCICQIYDDDKDANPSIVIVN